VSSLLRRVMDGDGVFGVALSMGRSVERRVAMKKIAIQMLIVSLASWGSMATVSYAQELYAHRATLDIFDVSDLSAITLKLSLPTPAIPGEGIALDGPGNLYVAIQGLAIFDANFNLIGEAIVNDPTPVTFANRAITVAVRPGQVFACNPVRLSPPDPPFARLFVFDTHDLQNPTLSRIVNIPFTDDFGGSECRGVKFDEEGHLWVTAHAALIKLTLDPAGNLIGAEEFSTFGIATAVDIDFQPGTGRIFHSAFNENFFRVLEPTNPNQEIARITNVCDNAIHSTAAMAFSNSGDLFVGCGNRLGATTDIVAFPAAALANINGIVDASALMPVKIAVPELNGGGSLAVKEITIAGLIEAVVNLNLGQGIEQSLVFGKLNPALRALGSGDTAAAVGSLTAFINEVNALIANGTLTVEAGQILIDAANAIIDQILTS